MVGLGGVERVVVVRRGIRTDRVIGVEGRKVRMREDMFFFLSFFLFSYFEVGDRMRDEGGGERVRRYVQCMARDQMSNASLRFRNRSRERILLIVAKQGNWLLCSTRVYTCVQFFFFSR